MRLELGGEGRPEGVAARLSNGGWRSRIPYLFRRSGRRVVWTGICALVGVSIVLGALAYATLNAAFQRKRAEAWNVHTFNVLLVVGELEAVLNAALRGERGYLITNDEGFLEPYNRAKREAPELLARLRSLTGDNADQQEMAEHLDLRMEEFFNTLERAIQRNRSGRRGDAFQLVRNGEGRDRAEHVFVVLREIEGEERQFLAERQAHRRAAEARSDIIRYAMISFGGVLVLIAAGVGLVAMDAHVRALDAAQELGRIATTDALTSLPNRRSFLAELERVATRSRRSGAPFSIAMFDIDHFKSVNDTYGHPAGDEVLRVLAQILRGSIRAGDVAARLGGEEFALMMPDTALVDAGIVCERVRKAVEAHGFVLPSGLTISATVSAGAAQMQRGELPSSVISRADTALYAAKNGGRNRVSLTG